MGKTLLIVICSILLAATACTISGAHTAPERQVTIGVIAPLTGGQAYNGEEVQRGVLLALRHNADIELIFEDSQSSRVHAVTAFKKLTEIDGAKIIIGPVLSGNVLSVAPLAEEEQVIILAPTASAKDVTNAGDYIFRVRETGAEHGKTMARYALDQSWGTAATLAIDAENGMTYMQGFAEEYTRHGGEIVAQELFNKDDADLRTQLTKIKAASPDVVYVSALADSTGRAVKQIRELGLTTVVLSNPAIEEGTFLSIAGQDAEGIIYTFPFNPDSALAQSFQTVFEETYGREMESYLAANAYDAAQLLVAATASCHEDTSCIKDYLYTVKNYAGVSGTFSFDANGDVERDLVIKEVRDGKRTITMLVGE